LWVVGDEPGLFDRTLEHLTGSRLLTLSGEEEEDGRRVDIAHESLIGGWPTLQEWVEERREAEQTRRRLEGKATEWVRLGRGSGGLLDEFELLETENWLHSPDAEGLGVSDRLDTLVNKSREAIEAAEREKEAARLRELEQARALVEETEARRLAEEQRAQEAEAREREQERAAKRLRRLAVGLAGAALLALVATILALRQVRITSARELAAQAQAALVQDRSHLAALLALEANKLNDGAGADVLAQVPYHAQAAYGHTLEGHIGEVLSVAWHPDGHTLASAGEDGRVIIWDVESGEPATFLEGHTDWIRSVA
jgi:hypothetical protein